MNGSDLVDMESATETEEMEADVELAIIDQEVGECLARGVRACAGSTRTGN